MRYVVVICLLICGLVGCNGLQFSNAAAPHKPALPALNNKKFALVLGGGGARGMAHIGVIEELERAGLKPDLIVGCSAGAIIGALYASNPDISSLKQLVLAGKRSDVITLSLKEWPYSIYDDSKLSGYLQKYITKTNFKDLHIPLLVTATNLEFGNTTAFGDGDIIAPIMASAAVPGIFAPVKIQGQYFVDCGAADPIPVSVARDLGFETIVAINIAQQLPETAPNHVFGVLKRSGEIAYVSLCTKSMAQADVKIDFKFTKIGMFSDQFNEYLYEEGKKAGKAAIPQILAAMQKNAAKKTT